MSKTNSGNAIKNAQTRTRFFWLMASASLLTAGAAGACSSSSDATGGSDASADGTTGDAAGDSGPLKDSGAKDSGKPPPGSCPAQTLAGECDLVLQNCDAGMECLPVIDSSNNVVAACQPASTGSSPLGHECCSNGPNNGNCVAGLFCNATCDVVDGGPGTKSGRCSPYCCLGDDTKCGESDPEGIKGTCSVTEVGTLPDGGPINFGSGCVYSTACKPFGVQPCADPTAICTIQADNVTFRCEGVFQQPALTAGANCHNIENACANGLECIGQLDASTCIYPCYQTNQDGGPPPFDASVITSTPGQGGCPGGQTCSAYVPGWPGWYGLCNP